jgi:hypothetical protein
MSSQRRKKFQRQGFVLFLGVLLFFYSVMLVGIGGNNGSSFVGMVLANKHKISWSTKKGEQHANFLGSLTQATAIRLGKCGEEDVFIPFKEILPMIDPVELSVTGWDINNMNLYDNFFLLYLFFFQGRCLTSCPSF